MEIEQFIRSNTAWVIEGCYTDLLELALKDSSEIIFMNLPVAACVENAKSRPWEPHKYATKQAQDDNLAMLIDWITQYKEQEDSFSMKSHLGLYENYSKVKKMYLKNNCNA